LADEASSEIVTAAHIFEALLTAPSPIIRRVLGDAVGPGEGKHKRTSLLDEYGSDLIQLAKEGKLPSMSSHKAESRALIEALKAPSSKSILLVSNSDDVVRSTALAAAQDIVTQNSMQELRKKQIIDVADARPSGEQSGQIIELLGKLLNEASSAEDVILIVPALEVASDKKSFDEWAGLLKKTLIKGLLQCICRVNTRTYEDHIRKDAFWKRNAYVIWMRDEVKDGIPREL
jgi:ATP-dependent Clp protease ATP-binding subunit ClpA